MTAGEPTVRRVSAAEPRTGESVVTADRPVPGAPWTRVWSREFITYRRLLLDDALEQAQSHMRGTVVDLGGKSDRKRGRFRPPTEGVERWLFVNIDTDTLPTIFADVGAVPLRDGIADCVVCTEVLEHLRDPGSCVSEAHRLLRVGGVALVSVPFLYPVHADPWDFQRYTADGLRYLFRRFSSVDVLPMGGYLGVLGATVESGVARVTGRGPHAIAMRRSLRFVARTLYWWELRSRAREAATADFTTGYFVRAWR